MKNKNRKDNESVSKLIVLVIAGVFGSILSFLIMFFVLQAIGPYYDIWYRSTNKVWHYLFGFLVWYAGAYLVIKTIRKRVDFVTNLLPVLSVMTLFGILWLIYIYIPSLFKYK